VSRSAGGRWEANTAAVAPTRYALADGVGAVISNRAGGVSPAPFDSLNLGLAVGDDPNAVAANRQALAAACGLQAADLAWMRQVHGATVRYVAAGPAGPVGPAGPTDAIFTNVPGIALCVQVADCMPVLVADPAARIIGAAHAGREGMAGGVVPALIAAMTAAGARPAAMQALVGPGICGGCYEVPEELRARVSAIVPEASCVTCAGTAGLDIRAGVLAQLAAAGVASTQVDGRCTRESAELYSYRRDGTTGRFAGLIWLIPRPDLGTA
jgi:polyphenol oxidase